MLMMNSPAAMSPVIAPAATDGVFALLSLLADADGTRKKLGELVAARDEAEAAYAKLADLESKHAALAKERQDFEAACIAECGRLQDTRDSLNSDRAELAANRQEHQRQVDAMASERAELGKSQRAHAERLAALEQARRALT
jgi:hypothetical protein